MKKVIALIAIMVMLCTTSVFAAMPENLKYSHTVDKRVGYNNNYGYYTYFTRTYLGNHTAYCIDYGRRVPAGGTSLPVGRNLSTRALSVIVHGFPNKTPAQLGVNSEDEAYYATQLAFWIAARGEGRKNPLSLNLNHISPVNGMGTFYNNSAAAARKILANADNHPYSYAKPTVSVNSSNAKVEYKNGKTVVGPYQITGSNLTENIKVTMENAPSSAKLSKTEVSSGESVYVEMNMEEASSALNVVASSAGVIFEGKAYHTYPRDMQDFGVAIKSRVPVTSKQEVKWTSPKGSVKVVKVDQNNERIVGVKFELQKQDGTKVAEAVTDKNGIVSFENILPGKYKLVEVAAPEGYVMGDKPLEFDVETGKTFTAEVKNTKILGNLKIVKKDDLTKEPLAGVKFEVLNDKKEVIDTIITDKDGIATSKDLPQGKYYYREAEVPEGIIIDKKEYEFEIKEAGMLIEKEIINVKVKGYLEILKLDKDTKQPIPGVKFDVLDEKGEKIETIVTNEQGIAKSKVLVKGKYKFVEVEAAKGYVENKKKVDFEIKENDEVVKITVDNVKKTLPVTGGLGTNIMIVTMIAGVSIGGYFAFKKYFN